MLTIARKFSFNAAHRLSETVSEGHPCSRVHGHTYKGEFSITTAREPHELGGMFVDFSVLKQLLKKEVEDFFDHKFLTSDVNISKEGTVILPIDPTVEYLTYLSTIKMYFALKNVLSHSVFDAIASLCTTLYETERSWGAYSLMLPVNNEDTLVKELSSVKNT